MYVITVHAEEYNYYQMGILPSEFYTALTGRSPSKFKETLWKMFVVIVSVCIVSLCVTYSHCELHTCRLGTTPDDPE